MVVWSTQGRIIGRICASHTFKEVVLDKKSTFYVEVTLYRDSPLVEAAS